MENRIFLVFIKEKVEYEKFCVKGGGIKVVRVCCLWKNKSGDKKKAILGKAL